MGKVDGRYPHWVTPYTGERYSVIYYRTVGEVDPMGPAVVPTPEAVPGAEAHSVKVEDKVEIPSKRKPDIETEAIYVQEAGACRAAKTKKFNLIDCTHSTTSSNKEDDKVIE